MTEAEMKSEIEEVRRMAREEIAALRREMEAMRGQVSDHQRKFDGASLHLDCDGTTLRGSITWGG